MDTCRVEVSPKATRFLAALREVGVVARACRLAKVSRSAVYLMWRRDAAFREAMDAVLDAFFQEVRDRAIAGEQERKAVRQARERERHPMRCENLVLAREAKRRKRCGVPAPYRGDKFW